MKDKLQELIYEASGIRDFEDSSKLNDDLGLDELDMLEFCWRIEEELDVKIYHEIAEIISTKTVITFHE